MPGAQPVMSYAYTYDWTADDVVQLVHVAAELDAKPLDLAGCWMSESGLHSIAHNPNGNATGIFQAMPATLRGLGYTGTWDQFQHEALAVQLNFAAKYYAPHRGQLVSPAACYLSTFLPAFMSHAGDPSFVLCTTDDPLVIPVPVHPGWYKANRGLDVNGDGKITVQDLADKIARSTVGPRWAEFAARVNAAMMQESGEVGSDET